MQTDKDTPQYYVYSLTARSARKLEQYYNRVLAPLGLTIRQVMALDILRQEDGMSLGVFARRASIGKAAAVTMVQRLEAIGLVTRHPHGRDARLNEIRLTSKARDVEPLILTRVRELEQTLEAALGPRRLKTISRGLAEILDLDL